MNYIKSLLVATGLFTASLSANAGLITEEYTDGFQYDISALETFSTAGAEMVGMEITAIHVGGTQETLVWQQVAGSTYGVAGLGWSFEFSGATTYSSVFTLLSSTADLATLIINGRPGSTLFDVERGASTPNSARGRGPQVNANNTLADVNFNYTDIVSFDGTAYGDLFSRLEISFSGGFGQNSELSFITDTDNFSGRITQVPVTSSALLLAIGLLGLRKRS